MEILIKINDQVVATLSNEDVKALDSQIVCGLSWITAGLMGEIDNKIKGSFQHMLSNYVQEAVVVNGALSGTREDQINQITSLPNYRSRRARDIELLLTTEKDIAQIAALEIELADDIAKYAAVV